MSKDNNLLILVLLALVCVLCGFWVNSAFYIGAVILAFIILYHLLTTRR